MPVGLARVTRLTTGLVVVRLPLARLSEVPNPLAKHSTLRSFEAGSVRQGGKPTTAALHLTSAALRRRGGGGNPLRRKSQPNWRESGAGVLRQRSAANLPLRLRDVRCDSATTAQRS